MSIKIATAINNIIVANPQAFAIDNTLSHTQWRSLFGSIFKLPRSVRPQGNQLAYVNSYAAVNRVLRKRGFKVKSSNYYTNYTITGLVSARREVVNMTTRAKAILNAANELAANIPNSSRKYRFRSLRTAEINSVGRYVTTPITYR